MKKLVIALLVMLLLSFSFAQEAPAGSWDFTWTKLDLSKVPDLGGYRIYLVKEGDPVVTGTGLHFWQSPDNDPTLPMTLTDIPEGKWDSYLTSFDLGGQESPPSPLCLVDIDDAPPTPSGYSCGPPGTL